MQANNQINSIYDYFTTVGCDGRKADKLVTVDLNLVPKRHKLIRCAIKIQHKLPFLGNFVKNTHLPTVITTLEKFVYTISEPSNEVHSQALFVLTVLKNIRNNQDTHLTTLAKINQLQVPPIHEIPPPKDILAHYQKTILQNQSPWAKLPLEILEKIFLLTSPNTFKSCALVCKNWSASAMNPQTVNNNLGNANYMLLMDSFPPLTPPYRAFCAYTNKDVTKYFKKYSETSTTRIDALKLAMNKKDLENCTLSRILSPPVIDEPLPVIGTAGQIALRGSHYNGDIVALDMKNRSILTTFPAVNPAHFPDNAYLYKGCLIVKKRFWGVMHIHDIFTKELLHEEAIPKHTLALCDENGPQLVLDVSAMKSALEKEKIVAAHWNEIIKRQ
jgi:hypothetical protein